MGCCAELLKPVEIPQVQFLDRWRHAVVVTTWLGVQTCRKLWFSTVAVLGMVADVPARAVHRPGVDVLVSMQRRGCQGAW